MFFYLWALPYTLLGASVGCLGLLSGGRLERHTGVWEFHGGFCVRFLNLMPLSNVAAITLGHVVIGRDQASLDRTRTHERVHVRQFERWGPVMGIAYVLCSAQLWLSGRDAYWENPFEVEAYREADGIDPLSDRP